MKRLDLEDGRMVLASITPMYRRNRRGVPYRRATDWFAQAGDGPIGWGPTRRQAIAHLKEIIAAVPRPEYKNNLWRR